MTLVLGIDPGTATTGFGLVRERDDGSLELVEFGIISTPKEEAAHHRLVQLYDEMKKIIKRHKPDSVGVEKLFFQRNISTAIAVGQARGVVMLAIAQAGLDVAEYTPNEVKQAVAGYGSADKKQVQEMVRVLLSMPSIPKPDDAADALAIAITHIHTRRYS
jgi:crossover junction endodeoxyribonuclease RuvC